MKIYTKWNHGRNELCPVCNTSEDKDLIYVTNESVEGNALLGVQVHIDCLDLRYQRAHPNMATIYQHILPRREDDNGKVTQPKRALGWLFKRWA